MSAYGNPLIGDNPVQAYDRVNGLLELLRSVDYSGKTGVMPDDAEIALCDLFGMMQEALRYEADRHSKSSPPGLVSIQG